MFPKSKRLTAADFKHKQNEVRYRGRFLSLQCWHPPKTATENRYAVVIPKKVVRCATERNRLKRQLLHFLKNTDKSIKQTGCACAVILHQKAPIGHYQKDLRELFTKSTELSTTTQLGGS